MDTFKSKLETYSIENKISIKVDKFTLFLIMLCLGN